MSRRRAGHCGSRNGTATLFVALDVLEGTVLGRCMQRHRRIRRGSLHSVVDLQAAINRYIAEHNADPKPFTWTTTPEPILTKLESSECVCELGGSG